MNHNIQIPSFSNELPVQWGNVAINCHHHLCQQVLVLVLVLWEEFLQGGNKETDTSTAVASGAGGGSGPKRNTRLAAVQKASWESRLL